MMKMVTMMASIKTPTKPWTKTANHSKLQVLKYFGFCAKTTRIQYTMRAAMNGTVALTA